MSQEVHVDVASIRRRFRSAQGRGLWTSLEDLAGSAGFQTFLEREFPEQASEWNDPEGRRNFLKIMGASLALAGVTGCTRQPDEKIVPYVKAPEDLIPGRPLYFATAVSHGGYARGVLVESHEGRPTKIEGNPEHPASLGATDVFGQAEILQLYDPDRSQAIRFYRQTRTWGNFVEAIRQALDAQRPFQGAGLRLLTGTVTSPTLAQQIRDLLQELPQARWHQWDSANRDSVRAGSQLAFGEMVEAQHRLDRADVVVSLDADFVGSGPAALRDIRGFAARRRGDGRDLRPSRLYAIESAPSLTGGTADHRYAVKPSEVEGVARALAAELGLAVTGGSSQPWLKAMADDLRAAGAAGLVMAGESQPAAVHALAHAINASLGAVGTTVVYTASPEANPVVQLDSLRELVADMDAGKVRLLVIIGGNPVYTAPADLDFAAKMDKVALRVRLGLHDDETSERCQWHLPMAHVLESWSDVRAVDGTVTLVQPLIAPLYGGKTDHEFLAAFSKHSDRSSHDIVREYWKAQDATDFERRWNRALHDGVIAGSAFPARAVAFRPGDWMKAAPPSAAGLELAFRPDPCLHDGTYSNNGWMQELPRPLTKLTWDNAVLMSPRQAEALGVRVPTQTHLGSVADVVEVEAGGRKLRGPAWVMPGHPEGSFTVYLGYGRTRAGRVGNQIGFDAGALRTAAGLWATSGVQVRKTGDTATLACTQDHWRMEGRNPVRAVTVEELRANPEAVQHMGEAPAPGLTMYPDEHKYEGHAWGMAIDLTSCVGCNACVTACQAENNIPVVGKDQVGRGREMQWIRIDRYFEGPADAPATYHQPVLCQHCENAPCEVVCPVAATVHSDEGLNDMVYNRCVGTKYCSNNCPYKVRRFNFYLYQDWDTPSLKLQRNPDVTVRSRGVMEKCTYCVQRINEARINAKNENRPIRDGEITTACQQACPAQAIAFGDVNDPTSQVSRLKQQHRNYGLLAELNTRPRTTYLAAVSNPNPQLQAPKAGGHHG
jgi:molybdopterin-containing oxidoreductase family iron-sulfur binding subunit